jgi:hypothetical protein
MTGEFINSPPVVPVPFMPANGIDQQEDEKGSRQSASYPHKQNGILGRQYVAGIIHVSDRWLSKLQIQQFCRIKNQLPLLEAGAII